MKLFPLPVVGIASDNADLKKINEIVERYHPLNDEEESVQDIYKFILKLHTKKSFYFLNERILEYSEQDFIVKFWGYVMETFFGGDDHLLIRWGETMSSSNKKVNLRMKLDMRVMILKQGRYVMDGLNGEYARKHMNGKLYKDRLKLVLGGMSYLKEIRETCQYLEEKEITGIKIPFIQIMGFNAIVSIIRLEDTGLFVTEDLMIKALSLVKHLLKTLEETIEEGRVKDNDDMMKNIINEVGKGPKPNLKLWVDKICGDLARL
ncbi:hypothetical protein INT47_010816 [Mucor saturninus]|uniref:Uncharacterized protein n=1 Tax=Mucor saturninus TaxID=64648 RepID=A0A8H7QYC5_9FUNG|nr:hypothetical protein INT47_010816 [Mucor saturninus]